MKEQRDLFDLPPARYPLAPGHRGVPTSVEAARSMLPHHSAQERRVLDYLRSCGADGAIYTAIMDACDLGAPSVSARMRALVAGGDAVVHPTLTRLTPSRRRARVYLHKEFKP